MEFVSNDPKATVRAANVKATLDAFQLVPTLGRKLIERHKLAIDDLRPDNFILVQRWLDALRDIQQEVGPAKVRTVGSFTVENADIPPIFATADDMIMVINDLYHANHRGDVGNYIVTRTNETTLEVRCETPYPRMFEWGLIEGFCKNQRFKHPGRYKIDYLEAKPGEKHTCTLTVRRQG